MSMTDEMAAARQIARLATELRRSEAFIQSVRDELGVKPGESLMDAITNRTSTERLIAEERELRVRTDEMLEVWLERIEKCIASKVDAANAALEDIDRSFDKVHDRLLDLETPPTLTVLDRRTGARRRVTVKPGETIVLHADEDVIR